MANEIAVAPEGEGTNQDSIARPYLPVIWKAQGAGLVLLTAMSFFPALFHLEEYLFFVLLAVAMWAGWREERVIWARSPIDVPLLLLLGWVLLTVPFATDPWYSFAEWRKLVAQVLVFYWALLVLRVQPNGIVTKGVLAAVIIGTAGLCGYTLVDFVERGGTWKDRFVRGRAPFSDYNWLSTYLIIAIPVLVSAMVIVRTAWQRLACGGIVVLALLAQVISYTRAGWLALVAQGVTFGLVSRRRRIALWTLGSSLVIGAGLLSVSQLGYQRDTVDPWTLNTRLQAWQAGIVEILKHPLVGSGYGNYSFSTIVHGTPIGDTVMGLHNTFLMVGVGAGIPALATIVWVLVAIAKAGFGRFKIGKDQWERLVSLALVLIVVGFSARNFFAYMFAGSLAYLFWILVATGLAGKTRADT